MKTFVAVLLASVFISQTQAQNNPDVKLKGPAAADILVRLKKQVMECEGYSDDPEKDGYKYNKEEDNYYKPCSMYERAYYVPIFYSPDRRDALVFIYAEMPGGGNAIWFFTELCRKTGKNYQHATDYIELHEVTPVMLSFDLEQFRLQRV